MYNSPTTKILVAVSEQVFEPMQVPILIGNEVFIVMQQDIRKIEDSRHLSFRRLNNDNNNNNNIKNEIQIDNNGINNSNIFDAINNAYNLRESTEQQISYLQEQQRNMNMTNIGNSPIQMQIDLEKQSFNSNIIKCNNCECSKLNRSDIFHHCENGHRCRGVNTDSLLLIGNNKECKCESISARDQLKFKKKCQNTVAI